MTETMTSAEYRRKYGKKKGRRSSKPDWEGRLLQQILLCDLPEPKREYKFHANRRWRFDFAWKKQLVACEVEGGIYSGGRHVRGKGYEADCEKYNEAALYGWTLIRVTPSMIKSGAAIDWLERALLD